MAVTVMNLSTTEKILYTCSPREAVIAAYAQHPGTPPAIGDWNTWDYAQRYNHLVEEGKETLLCGDWSAFKDGREF